MAIEIGRYEEEVFGNETWSFFAGVGPGGSAGSSD
jgi:hypothetical protein